MSDETTLAEVTGVLARILRQRPEQTVGGAVAGALEQVEAALRTIDDGQAPPGGRTVVEAMLVALRQIVHGVEVRGIGAASWPASPAARQVLSGLMSVGPGSSVLR